MTFEEGPWSMFRAHWSLLIYIYMYISWCSVTCFLAIPKQSMPTCTALTLFLVGSGSHQKLWDGEALATLLVTSPTESKSLNKFCHLHGHLLTLFYGKWISELQEERPASKSKNYCQASYHCESLELKSVGKILRASVEHRPQSYPVQGARELGYLCTNSG